MTNEEARIIVEQLDNYLSHTCQDYGERDHEAMTTAIKALEREPQTFEWCTDCREYDQEKHCCPRYTKVIRNTVEEMKQPKTGQWVLLDECSNSGYYCSECHKKLVKEGYSDTVKKIKYCPNCGCRMVEPQESEETDDRG